MIKTIKDFDVKNKRVLVRCDFNVPLTEKGEVEDDFKIRQTIPTIKYLIENNAKIILMSHLDKPHGKVIENLRLDCVKNSLEKLLNISIKKTSDCIGKEVKKAAFNLKPKEILLLENLRFYKEEEENDDNFAKQLSELGEIYINDAFATCHREHASVVGVPKYLPSAAGLLLEKEIKALSKVLENPWRPLVVIIGGVKIENKLKLIKNFLEKADHLLIGGKIANELLIIKGICLGIPTSTEKIIKEIENLNLTSPKLHLPIDALVSLNAEGEGYVRETALGKVRKEEIILDIGPHTVEIFSRIIEEAKMIVFSGPLGYFENPLFEKGTREIAEKITKNHKAFKIAGGGDTIFALSKFDLLDKFDHVSTGGGAMLNFLSGEKMPGIEILKNE
ncbi:MAG TPA: phosphoglycerate kinase [Candidatus Pacearchaeota archaeon]|nr:phosphoglycerate kinase [Candidatus Pacearchaeota archaeon]